MTVRARWLIVGAAFTFLSAVAEPARAQQANTAAQESLFKEGLAFIDQGEWAQAIDRFKRVNQISPSAGALFNMGDAYVKLGKLASAWTSYSEAEKVARQTSQTARADDIHKQVVKLAPKIGKLSINAAPGRVPSLIVNRNGEKVDPAALNAPIPTDAGHYVIDVTAEGKKSFHTAVDVADGATQAVQIPELDPEDAPVTPPPAPPPAPNELQRNIGIGMEIGGGVVLVAGFIFGGVAMGTWNSVKDVCPNHNCVDKATRSKELSDYDSARTFSTLSTIGVIAGAAIGVGGLVLHLTAPKHDVTVTTTGMGMSLTITD